MNLPKREPWLLLDTGAGDPAWNMALDEVLLNWCWSVGRPVVRFYDWRQPAATFGYFQRFREVATWTNLRPLIRRPTGGGLVPHAGDWTYSIAVPVGHPWHQLRARESYLRVHGWVAAGFEALGMTVTLAARAQAGEPGRCFLGAELGDVLWLGRKVAGAAQRRNRLGLLIQGSIEPPPPASSSRPDFERALLDAGSQAWGVVWVRAELPEPLHVQAQELAIRKYGCAAYNEAR